MTLLIIIELILALVLVFLVLLQGSDNEGLGLGGSTGLGGLMTPRGSSNLLTRLTAITATLFMIMSIILTISATINSKKNVLKALPKIQTEEKIQDDSQESNILETN
ncbi:MAG: hypothetical protein CFH19_00520 [Alphaproteobacteria bacterium MarineAlpha5_Bin9]|nr:MAG: hypothetical protein CFH19_00520 [Alphaproteobacteria bacterium MarineAlpha5_Bin9]|tara:strand:- start:733 stop:1053 length:321 start_codon:yes stop_codon:yes gene_type:complete